MRTAPFSDGVPMVSQWPIEPGQSFLYELHPEEGDAGTYFYHSHVGFQAHTAYAPLIVEGAKPYDYDGEHTLIFSDFYPKTDDEIEKQAANRPKGPPPTRPPPGTRPPGGGGPGGGSQAISVNGQSGKCTFNDDSKDKSCKPYVIEVEPDKTYRIRFIGATVDTFLMFGIEDHDELSIIEADGQYTKEAETDYLQFGPGQRYSILLETKSEDDLDDKCSYWVRYQSTGPRDLGGYALLRYKSDSCDDDDLPDVLPSESPVDLTKDRSEYTQWMEYKLTPLDEDQAKKDFPTSDEVTRTIIMDITGPPTWK
jgi:L-ascorbate oxidase